MPTNAYGDEIVDPTPGLQRQPAALSFDEPQQPPIGAPKVNVYGDEVIGKDTPPAQPPVALTTYQERIRQAAIDDVNKGSDPSYFMARIMSEKLMGDTPESPEDELIYQRAFAKAYRQKLTEQAGRRGAAEYRAKQADKEIAETAEQLREHRSWGWRRGVTVGANNLVQNLGGVYARATGDDETANEIARSTARNSKALDIANSDNWIKPETFNVGQIANRLTHGLGAAGLAATTGGASTITGPALFAAEAYTDSLAHAEDAGMDPGKAKAYALTQAGVAGVLAHIIQKFPGLGNGEAVPPATFKEAVKEWGIDTAKQFPAMAGTNVIARLTDRAFNVDDGKPLTFGEIGHVIKDSAIDTALFSAAGALGRGTGLPEAPSRGDVKKWAALNPDLATEIGYTGRENAEARAELARKANELARQRQAEQPPEAKPKEVPPQTPPEAIPEPQESRQAGDNAALRSRVDALSPANRASLLKEIENLPEGQRAQRIEALMQQAYESSTDAVTGLPTRVQFQKLEAEGKLGPAKLAMDVIGLGGHNDHIAYAAGDALMRSVADSAKDVGLDLARWGGDELMAHGADFESLRAKANELNRILESKTFRFTDDSGTVRTLKGARVVFGLGESTDSAANTMEFAKEIASETGVRPAKGTLPRFLVEIDSEGRPIAPRRNAGGPGRERQRGIPAQDRIGGTEPFGGGQGAAAEAAPEPKQDLAKLTHRELQALAKSLGLRVGGKSADFIRKAVEIAQEKHEQARKAGGTYNPATGAVEFGGPGQLREGVRVAYKPIGSRKPRYANIEKIQEFGGKRLVTLDNGVTLPAERVKRLTGEAIREQETARLQSEHSPAEVKRIEKASSDARILTQRFLTDAEGFIREKHQLSDREKGLTGAANKELQEIIIRELEKRGMGHAGRDAQADMLPKLLEEALAKVSDGEIPLPDFKSVEVVGGVGQGDKIQLAGREWTAVEETPETVRLKDHDLPDIEVPQGMVPIDKGTQRKRGRAVDVPDFSEEGANQPGIQTGEGLFGQQVHEVTPETRTQQGTMFDNGVSPELRREREQAQRHKEAGGEELFQENRHNIPVEMEPAAERISNHEIVAGIAKLFQIPIRNGRLASRDALGVYKKLFEVIRLRPGFEADLAVTSHEVAHHIDKQSELSNTVPDRLKKELRDLDYDQKERRVHEGFAEYMRLRLTTDSAKQKAPEFHKWFEGTWAKDHHRFFERVEKVKELINQWRKQGALERVKANISDTGEAVRPAGVSAMEMLKSKAQAAWDRMYTAWKDEGHYLDLYNEKAKAQGLKVAKGDEPYQLYQALTQAGPTMANRAIDEGVFKLTGSMERIGPSLKEVFKDVPAHEYNDWIAWTYARHALEVWSKGKNPGIQEKDARYLYQKYRNPRWEQAANKLTDFNNALISMVADAGVITPEAAKRIKDEYLTYIPLMRVRDSMTKAGLGARKLVDVNEPLKRRTGSDLQIIDPVQATIERAVRLYQRASQQQVIESVVRAANTTEGLGAWVERVPPKMRGTEFSVEEVKKQLEKLGLDPMELENIPPEESLFLWRPDYKSKDGQPIARVMRNGKTELYQFNKDLYRAVSGMDVYRLPWFLSIFSKATSLFKLGATGLNSAFGARNPIKDYFTYMMQSKEARGPRSFVSPWEMIASNVLSSSKELAGQKGDPIVRLWKDMGGELSTSLGLDRSSLKRKVDDVLADDTKARMLNVVRNPVDAMRAIVGFSEAGPRLAEFKAVLEKHGWTKQRIEKGEAVPRAVLVEAINAAHEVTVNFKRMGYAGKAVNQVVPFFNAGLEGSDKIARTFKDQPLKTALYGTALITVPSLLYWWRHKDDNFYREQPGWLKYGFWVFTDKDLGIGKEGKPVLRIPRPTEWGQPFSAMPEAIAETIYRKDPGAMESALAHAADALAPNYKPVIVTPAAETFFNFDTFRGKPIVPEHLANREPKDQATPYNTELMKRIGEYLNWSPAKLEHFVDSATGGLYRGVETKLEGAATGKPMQTADMPFIGGLTLRQDYSQSMESFYRNLQALEQRYNSARDRAKAAGQKGAGDPALEKQHREQQAYAGLMADLRQLISGEADRDKRFEIEKYMIGLSRHALGEPELQRYPNPLSHEDEELPQSVADIRDEYLGKLVLHASAPMPKMKKGEPPQAYLDRVNDHLDAKEQALEALHGLGLNDLDIERLLLNKVLRAGGKVQGKAFEGRQRALMGQ